eukprot:236018-Pelagomonas_calceolata.AAC.3
MSPKAYEQECHYHELECKGSTPLGFKCTTSDFVLIMRCFFLAYTICLHNMVCNAPASLESNVRSSA